MAQVELKRFGENLKKILQDNGMSQKEFASAVGTTECAVSRYVNGLRGPSLSTLVKIRDVLGCSWEELMGEQHEDNNL